MGEKKLRLYWKGYWKPTPKGIRKLADSILAGATLATTFSVIYEHEKLGMTIMILAVIAKIFSNFFTDEPVEENEPNV